MTDPKPRATNKIGNAQQTSVVTALVSPTMALTRSRRISLLPQWPAARQRDTGTLPDFDRVETPRASWLNQQNGEEQMSWNGRDGKRHECAPLPERRRRRGNDDCGDGGECRRVRQHVRGTCDGGLSPSGGRGATVVGLRLADRTLGIRAVGFRFVHRTARAINAARHPCLWSRLPAGADCRVPRA